MKINWTLEKKSQFPLPDKIREELMEKIVHARGQMKLLIALFVFLHWTVGGVPERDGGGDESESEK